MLRVTAKRRATSQPSSRHKRQWRSHNRAPAAARNPEIEGIVVGLAQRNPTIGDGAPLMSGYAIANPTYTECLRSLTA
jgi:hypothetical protein